MAKYVLGIHDGHNASAAILRDGELLFVVQEERLNGQKNYNGFPSLSIRACLGFAGIEVGDLAHVAFAGCRQTPTQLRSYDQAAAARRDASLYGFVRRLFAWYPIYALSRELGWNERLEHASRLGIRSDICRAYNHHLGHAATAYFGMRENPRDAYLVVTIDGIGDLDCATIYRAEHGKLTLIAATPMGSSIGSIYGIVTGAMGFVPQEHEYKLMGMAPYASPQYAEAAASEFRALIEVDAEHLVFRRKTWEPTFCYPRRILKLLSGKRFDNICAGLQTVCEEVVVGLVQAAIRRTGLRRVLCAGGVFMNVKANKRLMELPEVEHLGIVPSCGDESLSFGVAWYAHAQAGDAAAAAIPPLRHAYLGPDFSEAETAAAVRGSGHEWKRYDDVESEVARVLAAGHPVARCKGRIEFGARALGNRSILADPANQDIVRIINRMVKKRDFWMPFAPVCRRANVPKYFVNPKNFASPYMMLTFDTRENFREFIAAVHNADLTARAQILEESHSPDYDRILRVFEQLTGRGVVLNTSFNLHGYPIVLGPKEALHVFDNSGLTYLAVGDYLVQKRSQAMPAGCRTGT